MKVFRMRILTATLILLISSAAPFATAGSEPERASPVGSMETTTELTPVDADQDPVWRRLFAHLSEPRTRFSTFTEARHFPFRRHPVELTGEIRISPDRGLSLRYLEPKEQLMIVDSAGVLMRDAKGRERSASGDKRATSISLALTQILRFDLAALEQNFTLRGKHTGSAWILEFQPRDEALKQSLGVITVEGRDDTLVGIEMRRSERQRIVITIGETLNDVTYTHDDITRYFR